MYKGGLSLGIIGGCGLGLLLGSEFSGRSAAILGAILEIIFFCSMGILLYRKK